MLRYIALVRTDVPEKCYDVPSSPILVVLMIKAMRSSETLDVTKTRRLNIQGDGFSHSKNDIIVKSWVIANLLNCKCDFVLKSISTKPCRLMG
jgi:hypothetical protein